MSYIPRHEGAQVRPSKQRLLLAASLVAAGAVALGLVLDNAGPIWLTVLIACWFAIAVGSVKPVLDGRTLRPSKKATVRRPRAGQSPN